MSVRDIVRAIKSHKVTVGRVSRLKYKDKQCMCIVITNLLRCVENNDMLLYSRDKERADVWVNNPKGVSNYSLMKCIDWLEDNMYLVNTKASSYQLYSESRKTSYVTATNLFKQDFYTPELALQAKESALATAQVVSLRDDEGKEIIYKSTETTNSLEKAMRDMNYNNAKHELFDEHGETVSETYSRLFKETWEQNGRMYSHGVMGVENRSSKGRLRFKIGVEPVVEVDYAALHIHIFADLNGKTLPEGDVYTNMLPYDLRTKANRDVMKGAVNRILNCNSHASATAAVRVSMQEVENHTLKSAKAVVALFYGLVGDLKPLLYKDRLGLKLANMESNIMADVIKVFVLLGKPIYPVHDSAIVLRADGALLSSTMADCYRKHLKVDRVVEMKYNMWVNDAEVKEDCSC